MTWRERALEEVPEAKKFLNDHSVKRSLEMLDLMEITPEWNSERDYWIQVQILKQAVQEAAEER